MQLTTQIHLLLDLGKKGRVAMDMKIVSAGINSSNWHEDCGDRHEVVTDMRIVATDMRTARNKT